MKPEVVIINSYAGSLLLGATAAGFPIRATLENAGYGMEIQRLNFGDREEITFREHTYDWPRFDMSKMLAIAHPPCSAFSVQNIKRKGTGDEAFKDTIRVLEYAMGQKTMALAIESVPGTMKGAWEVHDDYAKIYGYDIYRVLQNSISFGLPQWRSRFWAIFMRKGLLHSNKMHWRLKPDYVPIRVLLDGEAGPKDDRAEKKLSGQINLFKKRGVENWEELLSRKSGHLWSIIKQDRNLSASRKEISREYCFQGGFETGALTVIDPHEFAPVLLGNSWWFCLGQNIRPQQMKAIMGFPRDYGFPMKLAPKYLEFLSRGVCPPVAAWILENIHHNIAGTPKWYDWQDAKDKPKKLPVIIKTIEPGEIADFNLKKSEVIYG
ncbi:hypothetical protein LCGC14_1009210 [marine sediment metagenome]|uniref:DNA (cytosine-5-)-methyltransferase n=1 Tax=marine sediment metagenome TaxID=412755 RepID=A0A0F9NM44_9ZZZZ